MFFKNVIAYRLTQAVAFDVTELEELLTGKAHREPASQELSTYGFVAPFSAALVETALAPSGEYLLIAAKKTERILPGNVIRDELKKKVDAIEFEQQRKIYKKERDQIKDEIIQAFLPRAFLRSKVTYALIMPAAGLVLVDASSPKVAEDILSTLREVLGSLPVRPLSVKIAPVATMTDWVKVQKAADDFFVLDECEMRDTHEDGGTVKCKGQDLTSNEIEAHIATGKLVTKLSLAWKDKFSFILDDKLVIKRLRFEDLLQDQAEADGGDDAHGQLAASLIIMAGAFAEFFPALLEALGGEEIPQGVDGGGDEFEQQQKRELVEATAFVRKSGGVSISSIQRQFLWGYNRAARMIESLEEAGVITAMNSNGNREVVR